MKIYLYTQDELNTISLFDKINPKFWNIYKTELAPLRKNLREHYLPQQNYRCCYCKMLKQENHGATWDIEHIVPKDLFPLFMFTEENLCVSCKECNIHKLNTNVFTNNKHYKVYPNDSEKYKIVHPHFDKYSQHIDVKMYKNGHIIHYAISEKGRETFKICNLVRFSFKAHEYNVDADTLIEFSNYINNQKSLTPEEALAYFKASQPKVLSSKEVDTV